MTLPKPSPEQIAQVVASILNQGHAGNATVDGATVTVYSNNGAGLDEPFEVYPFAATFQEVNK